jgi:hypothetical protein
MRSLMSLAKSKQLCFRTPSTSPPSRSRSTHPSSLHMLPVPPPPSITRSCIPSMLEQTMWILFFDPLRKLSAPYHRSPPPRSRISSSRLRLHRSALPATRSTILPGPLPRRRRPVLDFEAQ